MSTKIWLAYRVPISRLAEATDILHEEMSKDFYQWWSSVLNNKYAADQIKEEITDLTEWVMSIEDKFAAIQKEHPFDFNSMHSRSFSFWLDKKYAYIIPYGNTGDLPDWFEDFHYQDQTDRDKSISTKAWRHREKKWDELLINNPKNREYRHYVVNAHAGFHMAFSEYTRRWLHAKLDEIEVQKDKCNGQKN